MISSIMLTTQILTCILSMFLFNEVGTDCVCTYHLEPIEPTKPLFIFRWYC